MVGIFPNYLGNSRPFITQIFGYYQKYCDLYQVKNLLVILGVFTNDESYHKVHYGRNLLFPNAWSTDYPGN